MSPAEQHTRALTMALLCLRNNCAPRRTLYWLQVSSDISESSKNEPTEVSARAFTMRVALCFLLLERDSHAV